MKGLLVIALAIVLGFMPAAVRAAETPHSMYGGTPPSKAADEAVGASMIGWGIALAIGITVLAIVLGSNDNSQAHSDS